MVSKLLFVFNLDSSEERVGALVSLLVAQRPTWREAECDAAYVAACSDPRITRVIGMAKAITPEVLTAIRDLPAVASCRVFSRNQALGYCQRHKIDMGGRFEIVQIEGVEGSYLRMRRAA